LPTFPVFLFFPRDAKAVASAHPHYNTTGIEGEFAPPILGKRLKQMQEVWSEPILPEIWGANSYMFILSK
jgi:hypothetical protein